MWWFGTFLLDFYLNCFVFPFCVVLFLFICHLLWLWWRGLSTLILSVRIICTTFCCRSHSSCKCMASTCALLCSQACRCFDSALQNVCTLLRYICSFHLFHSFSIFIHFVIWFSIIEIVVRFVFFGLFYFIYFCCSFFFILLSFVYCMYSTQFFAWGWMNFCWVSICRNQICE